mmetsp:Transcript_19662/g.45837  ORF Transcript_19662/g.45837 Transcript_19662/m.45837 type:complete len:400 (+) Transcript_19662:152-1351(+)
MAAHYWPAATAAATASKAATAAAPTIRGDLRGALMPAAAATTSSSPSSIFRAQPVALGALAGAAAAASARRLRYHHAPSPAAAPRRAQKPDSGRGGGSGDSEAAKLAEEAARIRAEAAALQKEADARRRKLLAGELLQGATSMSTRELQARLQEARSLSFSDEEMEALVAELGSKDGSVAAEALEDEKFQQILSRMQEEQQEAKRKLAMEKAENSMAEKAKAEEGSSPSKEQDESPIPVWFEAAPAGEDTGWAIRFAAAFGYLLPLVDALPYGFPLGAMAPPLVPFLNFLVPLYMFKDSIPFGTFIFLLLLSSLSRNPSFPRLLQFNWQQAVVMDVLCIIPQFIQALLFVELPEDLLLAFFVLLLGSVIYCFAVTLAAGKEPDALGFISDATNRNLGRW